MNVHLITSGNDDFTESARYKLFGDDFELRKKSLGHCSLFVNSSSAAIVESNEHIYVMLSSYHRRYPRYIVVIHRYAYLFVVYKI